MVEQKAQEQKHQKDTYQWKRRLVVTQATGMPLSISDTIINQADLYGLSVPFIIGVIAKETGNKFDPYLVHYNTNGTYDTGLMQINSRTRDWLAEAAGMPNADLFNPYDNVKLGVWYLHFLFVQCKGNEDCTLARYNGDSQNVYAPAVQCLVSRFGDRFRELWQQGE
jgi:soluble lytic murein transglycosylase-like protein